MDEALKIGTDAPRVSILPLALGGCVFALCCLLAQIFQNQAAMLAGFGALGAVSVWLLPLPLSIQFFYLYLMLDGAIKVMSNYNPVFHVAQDLIVIALLIRSVNDPRNGGVNKFSRTPHVSLLLMFALWILVQYLNPFGLGLLPSIAGTKVYVTGICVFLIAYHHLEKSQVERVLTWLAFLGLFESALATIEYLFFQGFVFKLHPRYAAIAGDRFVGELFRPFGTTSAPGAPSMWVFLTAGIAMHLLLNAKAKSARLVALLNLLFAIPTLVFCQTRAAILLSLASAVVVVLRPHGGFAKRMLLVAAFAGAVGLGISYLSWEKVMAIGGSESERVRAVQMQVLQDRLGTLTEKQALQTARSGAWDQMVTLAGQTVLGIGLSRVGAASAVWDQRIAADPYFGKNWSFADSLYRAVFTEIGVFGLIFWLAIILIPCFDLLRRSFRAGNATLWLCGTYPLVLLAGGFGSEGILYNPPSGFLWILLALGLKEAENFPLGT